MITQRYRDDFVSRRMDSAVCRLRLKYFVDPAAVSSIRSDSRTEFCQKPLNSHRMMLRFI